MLNAFFYFYDINNIIYHFSFLSLSLSLSLSLHRTLHPNGLAKPYTLNPEPLTLHQYHPRQAAPGRRGNLVQAIPDTTSPFQV